MRLQIVYRADASQRRNAEASMEPRGLERMTRDPLGGMDRKALPVCSVFPAINGCARHRDMQNSMQMEQCQRLFAYRHTNLKSLFPNKHGMPDFRDQRAAHAQQGVITLALEMLSCCAYATAPKSSWPAPAPLPSSLSPLASRRHHTAFALAPGAPECRGDPCAHPLLPRTLAAHSVQQSP